MEPLEWLARMADDIPDPGKHRTLFYSYYANRVRGDRAEEVLGQDKVEEEPAKKRRSTASWARLIAKVFHADPLTCRQCGAKLKIVAYLHDQVAIRQVLAHLGLGPPEEPKPPPAGHEVVRVPVDEEGLTGPAVTRETGVGSIVTATLVLGIGLSHATSHRAN